MGLLARAAKDLETGPALAKPGQGLFAKASKALTVLDEEIPLEYSAEPCPAPTEQDSIVEIQDLIPLQEEPRPQIPAFDMAILEGLGAEISSLSRSYDADLAVFSRLAEVLPLEGLALLFVRQTDLVLAAVHGKVFSHDPVTLPLSAHEGLLSKAGLLDPGAIASLERLLADDFPPAIYAHPGVSGPSGGGFLWLAASPAFEADEGLGREFSRLLGLAPRPPKEIQEPHFLSPKAAAESIKLGSGSAALHLLDFGPEFSFLKKAASESLASYSAGLVVTAALALVGQDGAAYLLENGRLAILSYSRRETDTELSRTQFRKSFKKALPFLFSSGLPDGASTTLDRSLASALEIFERLVSD